MTPAGSHRPEPQSDPATRDRPDQCLRDLPTIAPEPEAGRPDIYVLLCTSGCADAHRDSPGSRRPPRRRGPQLVVSDPSPPAPEEYGCRETGSSHGFSRSRASSSGEIAPGGQHLHSLEPACPLILGRAQAGGVQIFSLCAFGGRDPDLRRLELYERRHRPCRAWAVSVPVTVIRHDAVPDHRPASPGYQALSPPAPSTRPHRHPACGTGIPGPFGTRIGHRL